VPGDGRYEWKGFREDLPREFNPERGYIATANNNTHPEGYEGRPVFYHSTRGVETSRITRIHQILGKGETLSVEDHERIQYDAYSLQAERDIPAFQGWTSERSDIEWARSQVADWDGILTAESVPGAIYVTWTDFVDDAARDAATPIAERRTLAEEALSETIQHLAENFGTDRAQWRYGRIHVSPLSHMFASKFDLPPVERPGGFETVNATGANFRRIIDLSDIDNSVWTNAPGQSAQPGSPYYGNLRENLANGQYFPLLFSREAVDSRAAHRLTLNP
jgi:penicillin amidase